MSTPDGASLPASTNGNGGETSVRPWTEGLAPRLIGLFLVVVFFDQIGSETLRVGGLVPSLLGAGAGAVAAFLLLFVLPALWGQAHGRTSAELQAAAFGTRGSRWVADLLLGLVQVAWFSVAIAYACRLTLRALNQVGLVPDLALVPRSWGGFPVAGGPLWVYGLVVWSLPAVILGPLLIRVIAAVLYAYSLVPALLLGGLMLWSLGGLEASIRLEVSSRAASSAFWNMAELVLGYAMIAGPSAASWGRSCPRPRDVWLGGGVGLVLAPVIVAAVVLVTLQGFDGRQARQAAQPAPAAATDPQATDGAPLAASYSEAVFSSTLGNWPAWAIVTALALTMLGPCAYLPFGFRDHLARAWGGGHVVGWALVGAVLSWPLAISGLALDLPGMFRVLGTLTAPLVGVLAATALGDPAGRRVEQPGVRLAALVGWIGGMMVAAAALIGPSLGIAALARLQPGVLLAYVAAFGLTMVLGWIARGRAGSPSPRTLDP